MCIPIVTSIPPVFSRRDAAGKEIGAAYLERCIRSWQFYGFRPVTVNSEREPLHPLINQLGINVVRVKRDATALTGRPHVFLSDILETAFKFSGTSAAFIVNADIELEMDDVAQDLLHGLSAGQAVAAHRFDHGGDKTSVGLGYSGGIDLIGAGHKLWRGLNCGQLVFGMPWWDHYLPLILLARNAEFLSGQGIKPWHLDHGGRWKKAQHIDFGSEFLDCLLNADVTASSNKAFMHHVSQIKNSIRGHHDRVGVSAIKARVYAHFPSSMAHKRYVLKEVSRLNETLLNKIVEAKR